MGNLQTIDLAESQDGTEGGTGGRPSILLQELVANEESAVTNGQPESGYCFTFYRSFHRQRRRVVAFDPQTNEILGRVLSQLEVGDRIPLTLKIYSIWLDGNVRVGFGCGLTDAYACAEMSFGFEILGEPGQYAQMFACMHFSLGTFEMSSEATTGGVFGSAHVEASSGAPGGVASCVNVEQDPVPVGSELGVELEVVDCCESDIVIEAEVSGSTFVEYPFGLNLQNENLQVAEIPASPQCESEGVELQMTRLSFAGDVDENLIQSGGIIKTVEGGMSIIPNDVWVDSDLDGIPDETGNAVAYVRNSTIRVSADFMAFSPTEDTSVLLRATGQDGIVLESDWSTIGQTSPELAGVELTATSPLPNATKAYNTPPLQLTWSYSTNGIDFIEFGTTEHPLFVTLALPLESRDITYTALILGVGAGGAADPVNARIKTWFSFLGPANIRTWDGRPLRYYPNGFEFGSCSHSALELLKSATGAGQCGAFAFLLMDSFAVNGINSQRVAIVPTDSRMVVKNWIFETPSAIDSGDYQWVITLLNEGGDPGMVPAPPDNDYGDMTSTYGIPGQNTHTPSEKIFAVHYVVKVTEGLTDLYCDPSYGPAYCYAGKDPLQQLQDLAIDGFAQHFPLDDNSVYRVKKPNVLQIQEFPEP